MKQLEKSKELNKKHDLKDSADDFIQGKGDRLEIKSGTDVSKQSEYLKRKFIKRKKSLSSFLPKKKFESKDKFEKLGSFKTNLGPVSVGFHKFSGHPKFRFTLISSLEDDFDEGYAKRDFRDRLNYFNKDYRGKEKSYKENKTTVEFDPIEDDFDKISENNSDGEIEADDELLYDDDIEDEELKELRKNRSYFNASEFDGAVSDLKVIKNEKRDDNLEFEHELTKFSKMFMNHKLKKFEDSDQLKTEKLRIQSGEAYALRKRMEELKKLRQKLCNLINVIRLKKESERS